MRHCLAAIVLWLAGSALPVYSLAATFSLDNEFGIFVKMRGPIVPGDADRLVSLLLSVKPISPGSDFYTYPEAIYLDSPGGDVVEALRLASLVKALAIGAAVSPDGQRICASSCFLVYVAASRRSASGIDTIQRNGPKGTLGTLGIHRPYILQPEAGPDGARRQEDLMRRMREHLVASSVPQTLIDKMMSHASNDIYWLTSTEINSLGKYSPGLEEQLIAKCGYNAKIERTMSIREFAYSEMMSCVSDYTVKTYVPIRHTTVKRLRQGWRPWN